ncbi:hypothetical protein NDU88_004468 [Pleurodeles waltl]|uniref:Uncharacterized protein n=1 Tax=Pleurodeles waltl TaxID=8319 RepID=A0AAV7WXV6_PLEWA|nr:hypothetical protein NDU88_004468 [Pleurodeles waltl]
MFTPAKGTAPQSTTTTLGKKKTAIVHSKHSVPYYFGLPRPPSLLPQTAKSKERSLRPMNDYLSLRTGRHPTTQEEGTCRLLNQSASELYAALQLVEMSLNPNPRSPYKLSVFPHRRPLTEYVQQLDWLLCDPDVLKLRINNII